MGVWKKFYQNTKYNTTAKLLIEAVKYCKNKRNALDIGCGAGKDSVFLLKEGFRVLAIDSDNSVAEFIPTELLKSENFRLVIDSIEKFDLTKYRFDLINAQYSLPFISKDEFFPCIYRIIDSMSQDGIFVGQFFGLHDSWNKPTAKETFLSKKQAVNIFNNLNIIKLEEFEKDRPDASGRDKHWHVFDFIVEKNQQFARG
ncbi:methyltransferase domain-containing protein [Candidatus Dojkabacteria bacterium]|nr:methyltransferase domain-containing protein [Candidatus Dojkabacteria bacterium]